MKRPMLLILAAGIGLWLWLFAGVMFGNQNFAYRDSAHFYYPFYQLIQNEWGAGRIPLWNPHENVGQPLLANPTAGVLYPIKLIFALPIPYRISYAAYILWHLLQALLAAAWVARSWGASRLAAAMAGISFAFCGNVLFQYCNVVFLVGAAWLPITWWCGERMLRRKSWPSALGMGACLALMVLGGDPQLAYVAGISVSAYALIISWKNRRLLDPQARKRSARTPEARSSNKTSSKAEKDRSKPISVMPSTASDQRLHATSFRRLVEHPISLLFIAAVSGGLLSAVQILPSEEFSRRSLRANVPVPRSVPELAIRAFASKQRPELPALQRAAPPWYCGLLGKPPQTDQHHHTLYLFSVGPWRMLEYFFPNFSGRIAPSCGRWLKVFSAETTPWVPSLYMGLIPCILALLALRSRRVVNDASPNLNPPNSALSGIDKPGPDVVINDPTIVSWLSLLVIVFVMMSWGGFGPGWLMRCLLTGQICPACKYQQSTGSGWELPIGDEFGGLYWLCTVMLPGFVQFRFPAKMLLPAALGISWLGAMQFDRVQSDPIARQHFQRVMRIMAAIGFAGTLVALLLSFVWSSLMQFIPVDEFWGKFDVKSSHADLVMAFLQTALISACCGWMRWPVSGAESATTNSSSQQLPLPSSGILLVLLTIFDLGWSNGWMVMTETAKIWNEEPRCAALIAEAELSNAAGQDLKSTVADSVQPFRVYRIGNWYPEEWPDHTQSDHLALVTRWEHDTLISKYHLALQLDMLNGGSTFDLTEIAQFANTAYLPQQDKSMHYVQPRRGMDLWNVKYFLLPIHETFSSQHQSTLGLTRAWKEPRWTRKEPQGHPAGPPLENAVAEPERFLANVPDVRVLYNPSFLPRTWIVHNLVGIPELKSLSDPIAAAMLQPLLFPVNTYLDPRQTVLIESNELAAKPQGMTKQNNSIASDESVRITRYEPLEIVLEGELKSAGAVVLSDIFYPGWDVDIKLNDAAPRKGAICRANLGMRAVSLPEGRFTITFRYRPFWFRVGAAISLIAWIALICVTLIKHFLTKSAVAPAPTTMV